MPVKQNLYFIAIIPPEPIYSEVKEFQKHFDGKYKSKEAFKRPSHITLIHPFMISEDSEIDVKKFMQNFVGKHTPFELSVDGFGAFGFHTIYVACDENIVLKKLQKDLSLSFFKKFKVNEGKGSGLRFSAHMTIGFKDLTPPMFELGWAEFKDKIYRRKWTLKYICLLKHNFKEWEIIDHTELKGENIGETLGLGF